MERVTVSLPTEVRLAAQQLAVDAGVPFSTVVTDALTTLLQGRLVDAWLTDHQAEHGEFTEDELRSIAEEAGVQYVPPSADRRSA